jgi:hypothetical protein
MTLKVAGPKYLSSGGFITRLPITLRLLVKRMTSRIRGGVLELKTHTPETERIFEASFKATLDRYRKLLGQTGAGKLDSPNDNLTPAK